jgi:serine protease Do
MKNHNIRRKPPCLSGKQNFVWNLTRLLVTLAVSGISWYQFSLKTSVAQNLPTETKNVLPEDSDRSDVYSLLKSTTVRVVKADTAGSGVILRHQGNIYTVLTNWHVVDTDHAPIILTADDQQHQLVKPPEQIGNVDLAILQFQSQIEYPTAQINSQTPDVGAKVYAAGFPLTIGKIENTLSLGNQAFRLKPGKISVVPAKSFANGYRLGYTNDTEMGMSGSPIFNARGQVIGIHGRGKYRDPGFGVYVFEDGSEPQPEDLKRMVESSWGIPISTYLELSK